MNKLIAVLLVLLLAGCAQLNNLPSFKHCSEVHYNRIGGEVVIDAKCSVGYGAGVE